MLFFLVVLLTCCNDTVEEEENSSIIYEFNNTINCSVLGGSMNLSAMNTQVCEQAHSSLEAISTQAKFMSQRNFLQYVRYFLYRQNMAKIQKIQEE